MKSLIILIPLFLMGCKTGEQVHSQSSSPYVMVRENVGHGVERAENKEAVCYLYFQKSIHCFKKESAKLQETLDIFKEE